MPRPPRAARLPAWITAIPFLAMHVACLAAFFTGVTWFAVGLAAGLYVLRMFGISAGYHRYFSHRSYKTSRAFQFVLACLGCSALQKGPLWWAGHHRHHHRYSDQPDDLHSPVTSGFWWSHIGWVLTKDYDETNWQAIRDFRRYPELIWLNRNHWVPGLVLSGLCFLAGWLVDGGWLGGLTSLVWGFFVSTVVLYHCTFFVNSLNHLIGRKRYPTTDESRNNLVLALLTLGEGWHNNHHHYQSSANQGFFWWEIDVSYYLIRLLGLFRIVWDIRTPPEKVLQPVPVTVQDGR
jgi:stearoyl-CoA desaturase (delta-9 desaturase)